MANINLWGGVECTVNRVGDQYFDQLAKSGHDRRLSDLDLFADLGLTKIRYPVLWEHVAPKHPEQQNWAWATERLHKLRDLNIDPIVGLLHHGSGPRYTNLLDPDFPQKFAAYAKAVAQQFPWVTYYTPVNEPLTTARFSALYGLWYPHKNDDASFAKALLNQIKGTVLAMRAIREVNPNAQLVQTDDLGYIHSTPTLQYQADFENHRRWLSWDLLSGKVDQQHPLWNYLTNAQVPEEQLLELVANPCPPNVIGVNYYVTSERYLDERITEYPLHTHGSNGRHKYADVEAVRVTSAVPLGVQNLLAQVCERYPENQIAITEAHLCCTREEQMRWLAEVWDSALFLKNQGKNVIAVTAWSLLGAFDWNSLLTEERGFYEPGVFDVRNGKPEPNAVAKLLKGLADSADRHPVLQIDGWWKRSCRTLFPASPEVPETWCIGTQPSAQPKQNTVKPLLITGATGTLGRAFARICDTRGIPYVLLTRQEMDIAHEASVEKALRKYQPWAVVNTAGYVRVDDAENEPEACYRENAQGPVNLAKHCHARGIQLVTFSSDLVFDGQKGEGYLETDLPNPLNVYGGSKALAEEQVLKLMPRALVIRTSAFFGPWDQHNFVYHALRTLAHQEFFEAAADTFITPTYVPDLVNTTLDLLIDEECGIWHLANEGTYSWAGLAEAAARVAGVEPSPWLLSKPQEEFHYLAPRPTNVPLKTSKRAVLPPVEDALRRFLFASEIPFRPLLPKVEEGEEDSLLAAQA
ncbi:SDR family oxidoreductase [Rufibacter quisquiliarum]|uniref:dTDP-4-dehydrorhamnose reductase n=1 Tax=Rufibacter quisquiliarum TaxID=1549639 RepID=A0A839GIN8_9BACT|nr:SDR family oxidoreductase [Rufibacter quisquiliarum]MBA9079504.1 dTDP-4-dehydrorhamnose reductase [Rufibacter quisquiliarum]